MKSILTNAIIEGVRSKKDRSLGLSISTPELTVTEKAIFMELQGLNVKLQIIPIDEPSEEYKIDKDIEIKTQSQRIRNTLYILFSQDNEGLSFEQYYKLKTEKYIEFLKNKIE